MLSGGAEYTLYLTHESLITLNILVLFSLPPPLKMCCHYKKGENVEPCFVGDMLLTTTLTFDNEK